MDGIIYTFFPLLKHAITRTIKSESYEKIKFLIVRDEGIKIVLTLTF